MSSTTLMIPCEQALWVWRPLVGTGMPTEPSFLPSLCPQGLPAPGRCPCYLGEPQDPQDAGQPGEAGTQVKGCTRSKWEAKVFR